MVCRANCPTSWAFSLQRSWLALTLISRLAVAPAVKAGFGSQIPSSLKRVVKVPSVEARSSQFQTKHSQGTAKVEASKASKNGWPDTVTPHNKNPTQPHQTPAKKAVKFKPVLANATESKVNASKSFSTGPKEAVSHMGVHKNQCVKDGPLSGTCEQPPKRKDPDNSGRHTAVKVSAAASAKDPDNSRRQTAVKVSAKASTKDPDNLRRHTAVKVSAAASKKGPKAPGGIAAVKVSTTDSTKQAQASYPKSQKQIAGSSKKSGSAIKAPIVEENAPIAQRLNKSVAKTFQAIKVSKSGHTATTTTATATTTTTTTTMTFRSAKSIGNSFGTTAIQNSPELAASSRVLGSGVTSASSSAWRDVVHADASVKKSSNSHTAPSKKMEDKPQPIISRTFPLPAATLSALRLEASLGCTAAACLDWDKARLAWQYALNNLILAIRNLGTLQASAIPSVVLKAMRQATDSLRSLDADPNNKAELVSTSSACHHLLQEGGLWIQSLPDTTLTFNGLFPKLRLPHAIDIAQVHVPLISGRSMPMVGMGTHCLQAKNVQKSVGWALQEGYRRIDVAPRLLWEVGVGKAITDFLGNGGRREDIFISAQGHVGVNEADPSLIYQVLKTQLTALGLEYIDLYLLPGPGPSPEATAASWHELEKMFKLGLVRAIGVANFTGKELKALQNAASISPDVIQNNYGVHSPDIGSWIPGEQDAFHQVALPAKIMPSATGLLDSGTTPIPSLRDPHVLHIANRAGHLPAQVLLRWALQRGVAILPCSTSRKHIQENSRLFDFSLEDFDMAVLSNLATLVSSTPRGQHRPSWSKDLFSLSQEM